MRDYQEIVTTGQTHRRMDRQTHDKVIPMCRYGSQVTQKCCHTKVSKIKDGYQYMYLEQSCHISESPIQVTTVWNAVLTYIQLFEDIFNLFEDIFK